jgi:hypothetical protein
MTEQPSAEALKLASRYADGEVKKCAADIDALIAQGVSAERERWQNRDRQRLAQIDRLQETVQSHQQLSRKSTGEGPAPEASFAADLAAAQEPLGEEFEKVLHDNLDQLYVSSASPAVVDYSERAREIVRKSTFVYGSSIDGEPNHSWIDATTAQKEIAAALSAVASERDAAAIRAWGKRVWSDTEEVAYQAGVSNTLAWLQARLQEKHVREAAIEALRNARWPRAVAMQPLGEMAPGIRELYEREVDAIISHLKEMLK